MAEVRYLISDTAKKVDVESHVLRYWEDELEIQIPRNEMGHRYYTDYHVRLFRQIKELKEKGYQLKAIKNAMNKMSGEMGDIIITEDYMEEDMKASWKESRMREREAKEKEEQEKREKEKERAETLRGIREKMEGRIVEHPKKQRQEQRQEQSAGTKEQPEAIFYDLDQIEELGEEHNFAGNLKPEEVKGQKRQEEEGQAAAQAETQTAAQTVEILHPLQTMDISSEKMSQFQSIMNHIIGQAMESNMERISREITEEVSGQVCEQVSEALTETISDSVSENVTDRVMREVEYLMRVSDEKEEERFRQLDETIRAYQKNGKGRAEAAATKVPFFKKKRFGKSGRKLF